MDEDGEYDLTDFIGQDLMAWGNPGQGLRSHL